MILKKIYESPEFDLYMIALYDTICVSTTDPVEGDGLGGGGGDEGED